MHYTIPNYYGEFSCVADRCADTCCAGWEIAIDPASLARYKRTDGPLGNRLHNSIAWKKGSFKQYDGRCAFLDESGLCDLYAEGGPGMLCRTCRTYPRHVEEFEGVREISLCISCIEAARIVLGQKEPVHFLEFDREGREEDYGDFDFLLYTKLTDARELALRILQNRRRPAGERMAMALALAHDLQSRIDRNALFAADALFERYGEEGAPERFGARVADMAGSPKFRFDMLFCMTEDLGRLEALKADWPGQLEAIREALYGRGLADYARARLEFARFCGGTDWALWSEQLAVYFVFTYFCGAVYDGRAYGRMKFAVLSALIIGELAFGVFRLQGERLTFEDFVDIAHRYSREVEHSDDNREQLLALLDREERFGIEALAALALSV